MADDNHAVPAGLIPARAGTTCYRPRRSLACRAHPRSRGDHVSALPEPRTQPGSSPLARGPPSSVIVSPTSNGLIPARAGTTLCRLSVRHSRRAHPRSRGDHSSETQNRLVGLGSSPLARGPHLSQWEDEHVFGLIPARAGTTYSRSLCCRVHRAHPRSRGDHRRVSLITLRIVGSSPLARGPRNHGLADTIAAGLIPARAGTTDEGGSERVTARAHPRSRGDHGGARRKPLLRQGSSPLARGPPDAETPVDAAAGLIPARAGTTHKNGSGARLTGAHPRSRGDHRDPLCLRLMRQGSSPLARGPQFLLFACVLILGLIPARAGTTKHCFSS